MKITSILKFLYILGGSGLLCAPRIFRPSYSPVVHTISMVSLSAAGGLANDPRNLDSLLMVGLFLS